METDTRISEVFERYPNTRLDRDNFELFRGFLDGRLMISRCQDCRQWFQPPWPSCPSCWSDNVAFEEVSGKGEIFTFVILHAGPLQGVDGVDYVKGHPLVVVELEEQKGLRVTGTMSDCANDEIRIGMPVDLTWVGRMGAPVPAFRPAQQTARGQS